MSSTSASKKRKASTDTDTASQTAVAPAQTHYVYAVHSFETDYDGDGATRKLEALFTDLANANEAARRIHNKGKGALGAVEAEWMNKAVPEEKRVEAEGVELKTLPETRFEIEAVAEMVFCPRLRSDGGMRFGGATGEGCSWVVWVEPVGVDLPLPEEETEVSVQGKPAYAYEDEEEDDEEDQYEDMDRPWH